MTRIRGEVKGRFKNGEIVGLGEKMVWVADPGLARVCNFSNKM